MTLPNKIGFVKPMTRRGAGRKKPERFRSAFALNGD
jgi:hypothetical protein